MLTPCCQRRTASVTQDSQQDEGRCSRVGAIAGMTRARLFIQLEDLSAQLRQALHVGVGQARLPPQL